MTKRLSEEDRAILGTPTRRNAFCPIGKHGPRMLFPIKIGGRRVAEGCAECVLAIAKGEKPFRLPRADKPEAGS